LGGKLNWLLGGFVLDSTPDGPFGGFGSSQDVFKAFGLPISLGAGATMGYGFYSDRSLAGFANLSYDLSDFVPGLKFNAGYRYTFDKYSACSGTQPAVVAPSGYLDLSPSHYQIGPKGCAPNNPQFSNYSNIFGASSAPTWVVGLDWRANKSLFFYVTARQGYRAGGLNTPALGSKFVAAGLQTYAPEKVLDQEVGVKSDFHVMGWTSRLDLSVFHSDTTREQLVGTQISTATSRTPVCTPPSFTPWIDGDCNPNNDPTQTVLIVNGGETELVGLEGSLALSPFHGLVIDLGGSALSSDIKSSVPSILAPYLSGGTLLFTPKETATADVHYTLPVAPELGELVYSANYYYSSEVELGGVTAPSYSVWGMRLDWNDVLQHPVDFSLYVRNLFDKAYINGPAFTGPGNFVNTVQFGDPRTFGVQLRYRFGANTNRP
jgi:iron complex outermembrane receptor protein